ncbi:nucleobindin-2 isoform X2 [Leptopilina heterotoma]|uniref:nucleobindin-2 isoform X2 n=1 Tax=Leptopilina heterotoma TaxID=63436 RepID=UPI001CA9D078|nr:nucleobindin-2 isoform X2 [Leptopilina heterotoma]
MTKMKHFLIFALFFGIIQISVAPPVNKEEKKEDHEFEAMNDPFNKLEYQRYAREVIEVLETDPHFMKVLNSSSDEYIKSGDIAHELDYVNHHVRNRLDEIKRSEVQRLRRSISEVKARDEEQNGVGHFDHKNPHTFEREDLKKLIYQLHNDLEEYDKERKERFKEYEMEKKYEQEQKMKGMNEEDRKKYETEIHDNEEKHKKHDPLHHPGSKQQFEEVWKEEDHMTDQDFDPKTFFYMHDLDGNGYWDIEEINAIFRKELDKIYEVGHSEDDIIERVEEMERMREHFLKEADTNKDSLISYDEYLAVTNNPQFAVDSGWETIDENKQFTQEEYEAFEKKRMEDVKKSIDNHLSQMGQMPPNQQVPYHGQPVYQQQQQHLQQQQQQHLQQQQQQMQYQQYQQAPHQQVPQYQQVPHNQGPQYQQIPQHQVPQYQQVPPQYQQVPVHPGQVPQQVPGQQQQYQPAPQQYHPNQVNPQQYHQPGQVNHPQGQINQGQVNQPQGQVNQPQGQVNQPQGQVNQGQGNQPQGQVNQPQGQVNQPQGQGNQPQIQVNQPQGQVNQPQVQQPIQQVPVKSQNPDTEHLQNSIPNTK